MTINEELKEINLQEANEWKNRSRSKPLEEGGPWRINP